MKIIRTTAASIRGKGSYSVHEGVDHGTPIQTANPSPVAGSWAQQENNESQVIGTTPTTWSDCHGDLTDLIYFVIERDHDHGLAIQFALV